MKNVKKIICLVMAFALVFSFAACAEKKEKQENTPAVRHDVNIGMLKGPTGVGSAKLMEDNAAGTTLNNYNFTLLANPADMVSRVINGEVDIAALPTNSASVLYSKMNGGVQIAALNTLGVLYILTGEGVEVKSVEDLRGMNIYANGQGANPEFVLRYILEKNGLEPGKDVEITFGEADEIATNMAAGNIKVCMLPVPSATSVIMKNSAVTMALDLTEEYSAVTDNDSVLTMGCVVVRRDFAESNPEAVANFLTEYAQSIEYVKTEKEAASELIAKYEITPNAKIALAAIDDCNLVCISGSDIQSAIEGYYEVLYAAEPSSIGGAVPGADFYYVS